MIRRLFRLVSVLLVLGLAACWLFASLSARPKFRAAPDMGPNAQTVRFSSTDGLPLVGSFYPGSRDDSPAILLLHGNGSARGQFAKLAPRLNAKGFAILALDLRGHGESVQVSRSFGVNEARDAHAGFAWLKAHQRGAKTGILGTSLGGAAALLGDAGPVPAEALALHAVYPDIRHAIRNRIAQRLPYRIAVLAEPLLSYQSRLRFGAWPDDVSPRKALAHYAGPVMVIGGGADRSTPPDETHALAMAAPHLTREWIVPGLSHEQLTGGDDPAYYQALLDFFAQTLGGS